jgi:hypothetical protein
VSAYAAELWISKSKFIKLFVASGFFKIMAAAEFPSVLNHKGGRRDFNPQL